MIEVNSELIIAMKKFQEIFGDVVPLRELPSSITNEDLLSAIEESIEKETNLLPERFEYKKMEDDKNILM